MSFDINFNKLITRCEKLGFKGFIFTLSNIKYLDELYREYVIKKLEVRNLKKELKQKEEQIKRKINKV